MENVSSSNGLELYPKLRFPEFTEPWIVTTISKIMDRVSKPVDVEPDEEYRQIGIRSHGKGLFYKDSIKGIELGNKKVFWIEPDCFILNIVFAWERAVARTSCDEIGMIASHRFPMYKPRVGVLDLDYITQYFVTAYGHNLLKLASPGGAGRNKTLGQSDFLNSKVKIPTYAEQQKISSFLLLLQQRIDKQQQLVENLKKYKRGVLQYVFLNNCREQKTIDLKEVVSIYDGTHQTPEYKPDGIKFVSVENINDLEATAKYISLEAYNKEFKVHPEKGDVLMTRIGDIGRSCYVNFNEDMAFYVSLALLKCSERIDGRFLHHFIETEYFQHELWKRTLHIAFPKKINTGEIGDCKIAISPIETQVRISKELDLIDNKIKQIADIQCALMQIRIGMLQELFI